MRGNSMSIYVDQLSALTVFALLFTVHMDTDRTQCTESGPDAGVSFSVPEDEVPPGYNYKVCAWGGLASMILQNCQWFTHGNGDESVWLEVGG